MKKFLNKIVLFFLPAIFLTGIVIWVDFFKISGYQDYYSNQKVGINRGMVTTTTFNHFREKENYDSFIFGSSRSQAFKCKNWIAYLDNNSKPFHFDASSESIWGISKKIEYIDEVGVKIKNALVVIDRKLLMVTAPSQGHLFVAMPCISKSTKLDYYSNFIKASLNLKFLLAYADYSTFKTHREYMGKMIRSSKYDDLANKRNCDIWYGWDKEIKKDSLLYYKKRIDKGVFYKRPKLEISECQVTSLEIDQLKSIKTIFNKHKTAYKIIISPTYDQVPMEAAQVELLEQIFGRENVSDFSGKNKLTESISNFYESSHYRPHVANEIMSIVYQEKDSL